MMKTMEKGLEIQYIEHEESVQTMVTYNNGQAISKVSDLVGVQEVR
jgi:hypothetical protein